MTLDDLLMLTGRLDDESGFETARERFRRFLVERVTGIDPLGSLIEQCQHAASEQHRRALQDLVTHVGRSLGFITRFASYVPRSGEHKEDGLWQSSRGIDVALRVCSDPTQVPRPTPTSATASQPAKPRSLDLHVLTPACEARARLEGVLRAAHPESPRRVTTLRTVLSLAHMVGAGRLTHEDVARLLESGSDLDFVVELLERAANAATGQDTEPALDARAAGRSEPAYWVATIVTEQGATPDVIILHHIHERHTLEIAETIDAETAPQPGDGLCLHIASVGIVGSCQVRSVTDRRALPGEEGQFRRKLQLDRVVLHLGVPRSLGYEVQLRLRVEARRKPRGHWLARISQEEFTRVTAGTTHERGHEAAPRATGRNAEPDTGQNLSAGDPPSPS